MTVSTIAGVFVVSLGFLQQDAGVDRLVRFHDDLAGVTVSYPASFELKSAAEKQAAVAQSNAKLKASQPGKAVTISPDNIPLLASTAPGVPFAMVQFSRFDGKSINIPNVAVGLRDMATGVMKPFAKLMTDPPHWRHCAPEFGRW